ncbi:MAG: hypothetical protein U0802_05075 [Candidatus Binatia bacterium]
MQQRGEGRGAARFLAEARIGAHVRRGANASAATVSSEGAAGVAGLRFGDAQVAARHPGRCRRAFTRPQRGAIHRRRLVGMARRREDQCQQRRRRGLGKQRAARRRGAPARRLRRVAERQGLVRRPAPAGSA